MESWMQTARERSSIPTATCGYLELLYSANCSKQFSYFAFIRNRWIRATVGWLERPAASAREFILWPSSAMSLLKHEDGWTDHNVGLECGIIQYNFCIVLTDGLQEVREVCRIMLWRENWALDVQHCMWQKLHRKIIPHLLPFSEHIITFS